MTIGLTSDVDQPRWRTEVLRRASAVLRGRAVGVWQVSAGKLLLPVASNISTTLASAAAPEISSALKQLHMPAEPGSSWVAGHLAEVGQWCVAPVRATIPDPPPHAHERRSHERLALELAGLCLGLSDELAVGARATSVEANLYRIFTEQLGTFAKDVATHLGAPRAALARVDVTLRKSEQVDTAFRNRVLEEVETADRALAETTSIVRRLQDRARAVLAQSGDFDLVPVVWSVVDTERARAAARGVTIEVETLGYVIPVSGDAEELRQALGLLIRDAVHSLAGRAGTVGLTLANVGPVVRLTFRVPGAIAESAFAEVRHIVETRFGGDLTVASDPAVPATVMMLRLAVRQEGFPDIGRWRRS